MKGSISFSLVFIMILGTMATLLATGVITQTTRAITESAQPQNRYLDRMVDDINTVCENGGRTGGKVSLGGKKYLADEQTQEGYNVTLYDGNDNQIASEEVDCNIARPFNIRSGNYKITKVSGTDAVRVDTPYLQRGGE